jgi:hypothetical protein
MAMFSNEKVAKSSTNIYYCDVCDYNTSKKYNYNKHNSTGKHKMAMFSNEKVAKSSTYNCECGKVYKDNSGLWRHKKKCQTNSEPELVEYLSKENNELKNLIITTLQEQNKNIVELAKISGNNHNTEISNIAGNNHNIGNTTNNNQSFNLQFYLNNTCKDAMNIMDFVSQLNVGVKDLEETGRLGFAEGISKIIINGLNQIQVNDRPIHCSDSKRETIYIKNNDEWTKQGEDKTILTNAIKHVAHKNMKQISEWTKEHPEYSDPDSRENDKYLRIVSEAMSGTTKDECVKNYNKIIKNIAKETIIDK